MKAVRIGISFLMLLAAMQPVLAQQRRTAPARPAPRNAAAAANPITTRIEATHFVKGNRVLLRWAPMNEEGWRLANKYGYMLQKFTLSKDGQPLGGKNAFASFELKPDSLQYWMPLVDSNDNAAIMAQALYGDNFQLGLNSQAANQAGPSLLGKAATNKQRFAFALLAADNDFAIANAAGLGFADTVVNTKEKYFYRIFINAPKKLVHCDTGLVFVDMRDSFPLPKAPEMNTESSKQSVVLSWDMDRLREYYVSYYIERSDDNGETFHQLNDLPFTSFAQGSDPRRPNSLVYTDTALTNFKEYQYRIKGNTIFGEAGPYSDVVKTQSLSLLEGVPGIETIRLDEKGKPVVCWYFEDSIRPKVKNFDLEYAGKIDGDYQPLIKGMPSTAKEVLLPDSLSFAYLRIKAYSLEGGLSRTSFPYLYQPEDSTPPAPPVGLKGRVDSSGVVMLEWLPNAEKDLLGYKVFRTLVKDHEYEILVDTVYYNTKFNDTLDMKMKNRKVYYTVSALDTRHNQSRKGQPLMLEKPDVIPPSASVFTDFKNGDKQVELFWVNSVDDDLALVRLYRREGNGEWKTVFESGDTSKHHFVDKTVEPDKKYTYRLTAFDNGGLASQEAPVLNLQTMPLQIRKVIKEVSAQVDREKRLLYLNWICEQKADIKQIEIYRGDEKEGMSLYKVLSGGDRDMLENELTVNTLYKYGVRALLKNGQYSDFVVKEVKY
jgi:uncharacterized protein